MNSGVTRRRVVRCPTMTLKVWPVCSFFKVNSLRAASTETICPATRVKEPAMISSALKAEPSDARSPVARNWSPARISAKVAGCASATREESGA